MPNSTATDGDLITGTPDCLSGFQHAPGEYGLPLLVAAADIVEASRETNGLFTGGLRHRTPHQHHGFFKELEHFFAERAVLFHGFCHFRDLRLQAAIGRHHGSQLVHQLFGGGLSLVQGLHVRIQSGVKIPILHRTHMLLGDRNAFGQLAQRPLLVNELGLLINGNHLAGDAACLLINTVTNAGYALVNQGR